MVDMKAIPVPNDEFCERKVGDETVLLSDSGVEVLSLNGVGTYIWSQVDGQSDLEKIAKAMCQEYEVEQDQAATDLLAFVDRLLEHNLVSLGGSGA